MRIFYSFLFCTAFLQGMEPTNELAAATEDLAGEVHVQGYQKPVLKMVLQNRALQEKRSVSSSNASTNVGSIVASSSNAGTDTESATAQYAGDISLLLNKLGRVRQNFTEIEVLNTLKYYKENYPIHYPSFLGQLKTLPDEAAFHTPEQEKQKAEYALDFTLMAHENRGSLVEKHFDAATDLKQQNVELAQQHQIQTTKTKYANWRAYGVAVGGCIVTIITGLITYFAHPAGTSSSGSTTPPANNNTL